MVRSREKHRTYLRNGAQISVFNIELSIGVFKRVAIFNDSYNSVLTYSFQNLRYPLDRRHLVHLSEKYLVKIPQVILQISTKELV